MNLDSQQQLGINRAHKAHAEAIRRLLHYAGCMAAVGQAVSAWLSPQVARGDVKVSTDVFPVSI